MFHIHKWSKWTLLKSVAGPACDKNKRTCEKCGKVQYKWVM